MRSAPNSTDKCGDARRYVPILCVGLMIVCLLVFMLPATIAAQSDDRGAGDRAD